MPIISFALHEWQRRYGALRASFVERLPVKIVAKRYGYTPTYIHLLRHLFIHGKIDFSEPVPEDKTLRFVKKFEHGGNVAYLHVKSPNCYQKKV